MIKYLSQCILRAICASAVLLGMAFGSSDQPATASTPVLLDSADYTFAYPDPSDNNSLPDPVVWTALTQGNVVQLPINGGGLAMSDPDNSSSLMYVHNTPFLSGDPNDPKYQNTGTFSVRARVPYVLDGSSAWSAEAIAWRIILDDGNHRLELALSRDAAYGREVRVSNSPVDPISFPWDNGLYNTYEITRLADGNFLLTLTNADTSNPTPIHTRTVLGAQVSPSQGVPQFVWGMGGEGGGVAYWTEAHAEVYGQAANQAPTVGSITAPLDPVSVNTSISASASFTDPDSSDSHTATWNWGDGTTSAGSINETNGTGTVSGNHSYTAPGVYPLTLTVTDNHNASAQAAYNYIVIYDPSNGFVTGGGWIDSPAGAYAPNPSLSAKASFGFISKYLKGATTPTGQTEFQFKAADFSFRSTNYDWLVVGGAKAQFKGSGTINGGGDYAFLLTATDGQLTGSGEADKFRIKISEKSTGNIVYDNQMGASDSADPSTSLGGGAIVIHK